MAGTGPVGVGIAGCGNIAGPYASSLATRTDEVRLVGAFDPLPDRMQAFAEERGCRTCASLDELLADPEIEIVVNLTSHLAHAEVTRQALEAGKHVHSEKPLAKTREEGNQLVALASERSLCLGCSPFIALGEAQQTLWKVIRDGMIGKPLACYAEMNHSRIESWHPDPGPFYGAGAGPLLDVGCYPLNVLTTVLGPVAKVTGLASTLLPERVIQSGPKEGEKFTVTAHDHATGILEFENGTVGRLTASFTVGKSSQTGVEIHGEKGGLYLSGIGFNTPLQFCPIAEREWQDVPLVGDPFGGVEWSRGVADLADAVRTGRPPRCTGAQANHILDVCLSVLESSAQGHPVEVKSRFATPEPVYS